MNRVKSIKNKNGSAQKVSKNNAKAFYLGLVHDFLILIAGLIALLVIIYLLFFVWPKFSTKMTIENHLRAKYDRQFVVKEIELNGNGLGVKGIWQGVAYSEDDNLEFYVSKGEDSSIINDSYVSTTWAKEETVRSASGIKSIIPTAEVVKIDIGVGKDFLETLDNPLGSYLKVRMDNQDELSYTLTIVNKGELSNAADLLLKSIEILKTNGLKNIDIQYAERYPGKANMYGRTCTGDKTHSVEAISKCISDKVKIEEEQIR